VTTMVGVVDAFVEFPKIARLSREVVITEKIDGTNAQVYIAPSGTFVDVESIIAEHEDGRVMLAGSRNRYITPAADNFGFARWVKEHADELWQLGEGRHFGEWWGSGIQRGYGLQNGEKRFSLFNVARWADVRNREKFPNDRPACCHVVPVLSSPDAVFDNIDWRATLAWLAHHGSFAAPGFMKPEGIVIFHTASGQLFKKTIEKDEEPKSRGVGR
jgi:hypothetical protein